MKRLLLVVTLLASPAIAADNAIVLTPGVGVTERSIDTTGANGPQSPVVVLGGTTGTPIYGTAGSANSNVFTVQGIASGVPQSVSQSGAWTVQQGTPPWSVSQSGVWTVQPGNTANTTPWLVTAQQSGAWTVNPTTAASWGIQAQGTPTAGQAGVLNQAAVVTATPTYTATQTAPITMDTAGNVRINCSTGCGGAGTISNAGTNTTSSTNIGAVTYNYGWTGSLWEQIKSTAGSQNVNVTNATNPGRTLNGSAVSGASPVVQPSAPNTGSVPFPIFSTGATTAGVLVKTAAATLFGCQLGNTGTTVAFVKIYNKGSGAPVVGTDAPVKTLIVPGPAAGGGGSNPTFGPGGMALSNGFGIGITGGITNGDTSSVAPNAVVVNCDYE
jgi:hypothetical protein